LNLIFLFVCKIFYNTKTYFADGGFEFDFWCCCLFIYIEDSRFRYENLW